LASLIAEAQSLAIEGVETSTKLTYLNAWNQYTKFTNLYQLNLQVTMTNLQLFATYLHLQGKVITTIKVYIAAIKFWFQIATHQDLKHTFVLQKTLQGIAKKTPILPDSRLPITIPYLQAICNVLHHFSSPYETSLLSSAFTLAFFATLRISEVARTRASNHAIQTANVTCLPDSINIRLKSSKTVKLNQTEHLIHVKSHFPICPVLHLHRYLHQKPPSQYLFVHQDLSQLTYDQFLSALRRAAEIAGLPTKNFTTHSFRIGGTTYYHQQGWSDAALQQHGRWSTSAYKKYIRLF
jgi:site-specific recombinase XerD